MYGIIDKVYSFISEVLFMKIHVDILYHYTEYEYNSKDSMNNIFLLLIESSNNVCNLIKYKSVKINTSIRICQRKSIKK